MDNTLTRQYFGIAQDLNKYQIGGVIPFPYGVGIEIELEDMPRVRDTFKHWDVKGDGSLKNGVEFVTKGPLVSNTASSALKELNKYIFDSKIKPRLSERTSVHVHVDCRDMTKDQIINFVLTYVVFEKVLFNYCGKERESNIFCVSTYNAEGLLTTLAKVVNSRDNEVSRQIAGFTKYSSINLRPLAQYGSIEIRGHRGEYKAAELIKWINILLSIKHFAVNSNKEAFENLPQFISGTGVLKFLEVVFGKYSKYLSYKNIEEDILYGVRLVQELIYSDKFTDFHNRVAKVGLSLAASNNIKTFPDIFVKYMQNKYPKTYEAYTSIGEDEGDIKKEVIGKGKSYAIDNRGLTVTTVHGKTYPIISDGKDYYFINTAKTKVILKDERNIIATRRGQYSLEVEGHEPEDVRITATEALGGMRNIVDAAINPPRPARVRRVGDMYIPIDDQDED